MSRVLHYRHAYVRIFLSQNIVRKETLLKAIYHNNMVLYSELYNLISMVKIILVYFEKLLVWNILILITYIKKLCRLLNGDKTNTQKKQKRQKKENIKVKFCFSLNCNFLKDCV